MPPGTAPATAGHPTSMRSSGSATPTRSRSRIPTAPARSPWPRPPGGWAAAPASSTTGSTPGSSPPAAAPPAALRQPGNVGATCHPRITSSADAGLTSTAPHRSRTSRHVVAGEQYESSVATIRDRVAQASLKLVLEPIFEVDFLPCPYGFRPNRRAHDAVAEVHHFTSRSYEWVVEGDIKACFDEISHPALMDRVRRRVGDKRVLALVKAFLKAGVLTEDGTFADTSAGSPQGSILSPLLSNVALSVLDEFIAQGPGGPGASQYERAKRRRQGLPNYRLCRYADDWCLAVSGTKADAGALKEEIAEVLAGMGLRLSPEKTLITHIDEGLDFLGWRIQRHRKRGTSKHYVYVYPAKKALRAIMAKVKAVCWQNTNLPLGVLLRRLNSMLRGWTAYFKYGCSSATFGYLRHYLWHQVIRWIGRKHRRTPWRQLRRRYSGGDGWPTHGEVVLFNPAAVRTERYRYRGAQIAQPWPS